MEIFIDCFAPATKKKKKNMTLSLHCKHSEFSEENRPVNIWLKYRTNEMNVDQKTIRT